MLYSNSTENALEITPRVFGIAEELEEANRLVPKILQLGIALDKAEALGISVPKIKTAYDRSYASVLDITQISPLLITRVNTLEIAMSLVPVSLHTPLISENVNVSEVVAKQIIISKQDIISVDDIYDSVGGSPIGGGDGNPLKIDKLGASETVVLFNQDYFGEDYADPQAHYNGTVYTI